LLVFFVDRWVGERGDVPSLQIPANDGLVEEHKQGLFAVLFGDEPAEARSADVVPHLDAVDDGGGAGEGLLDHAGQAAQVERAVDERAGARGAARVVRVAGVVKHTHYQRVLAVLIPLTQENSAQCLAEESLTLNCNGVCCPPSARLTSEAGAEGGT
jgi:hypothetical protein